MPRNNTLTVAFATLALVSGYFATATPVFAAGKEKVLYRFCSVSNCTDGASPFAGLIFDKTGSLYGTTAGGGTGTNCWPEHGCGTVFKLTLDANGKWTEKVLYSFEGGADGVGPSELIFDKAGNLYGTTTSGGGNNQYCPSGCGVVFELRPRAKGAWTERILYSFCFTCQDGIYPEGGLVMDAGGNLYGTTDWGGGYGYGTVFELTPGANGAWTEKTLHSFDYSDGAYPLAGLIFDAAGNLYGTTSEPGGGNVFELTPGANGEWTESVLYSFNGKDGALPVASLIFDAAGNLYGTTFEGGVHGYGNVFELIPEGNGQWTETTLRSFYRKPKLPSGSLIFDSAGNLYGTTATGGAHDFGTVFRLSPGADGKWTLSSLHSFDGEDGRQPVSNLIFDASGNLYGITTDGGNLRLCDSFGCGTVFEITP
jgi:uncharacterized repeat protein (TIGR03803 family)